MGLQCNLQKIFESIVNYTYGHYLSGNYLSGNYFGNTLEAGVQTKKDAMSLNIEIKLKCLI